MALTIRRKIVVGIIATAASITSVIILDHAVFDSVNRRAAAAAGLMDRLLRTSETSAAVGHVRAHFCPHALQSAGDRDHLLGTVRRLEELLATNQAESTAASPGMIFAERFCAMAEAASASRAADPPDVVEIHAAANAAIESLETEQAAIHDEISALRSSLAHAGEHRATLHLAGHVIALGFLCFVCWVMMTSVVGPLRALHERIRRAEAGLPGDPLPASRDDELRPIIEGFNRMCSSLQARNDEIDVRSRRLAGLAVVSQAASCPTDLDRLLVEVLAESVKLMGNDVGLVRLLDPQTHRLCLAAVWGMRHGTERIPNETDIGEAITGLCVQVGEPIVVEDAALDPRMAPWLVREEGVRSAAAVPLFSRGKAIGALCVGARHNHHYRPDDLALLLTIGRFTAGGIDNIRLARATSDRAREVGVLLEIGRALGTARDFDTLADRMLEILARPLGADFGVLATLDPATNTLRVRGALGQRREDLRGTVMEVDPASLFLGAPKARAPAAVPIENDESDPWRRMRESWGLQSGVLVPIAHGGEGLGLLILGHTRSQAPFDTAFIPLATAAAGEIAFALRHDGASPSHSKAA